MDELKNNQIVLRKRGQSSSLTSLKLVLLNRARRLVLSVSEMLEFCKIS